MTETAHPALCFADLESFLAQGRFEDAKTLVVHSLEQNPFNREARLYLLLINITLDGPELWEEEIDQLRTVDHLSDIERDIIRRIFVIGCKSAEEAGRQH